jgi:surface antigen
MLAAMLLFTVATAAAQNQSVPGLVARQEAASLSFEDRIAAFDAEQAVLSQDYGVTGYQWEGPNGAYGTIISGDALPHDGGRRHCRRFIHIVHHKDDGGANPTFQGVVCRSEGGQWEPQ